MANSKLFQRKTYASAFIRNGSATVKVDTTIKPSPFCLCFLVGKVKETHYTFCLWAYLSEAFVVQNCMKAVIALRTLKNNE